MPVILRPACHSDHAAVCAIEAEAFGASAYPATYFIQAVDVHGAGYIVSEADGQVTGFIVAALGTPIPAPAMAAPSEPTPRPALAPVTTAPAAAIGPPKPIGWITGMAVATPYRRQGHGRALLFAGLDALRQQGCARARLTVAANNASAIGLYRSAGFVHRAIHPAVFGDGQGRLIFEAGL